MSSKYTDEFRREIVALRKGGKSVVELCRTYKLGKNTVTGWVKQSDGLVQARPKVVMSKDQQELKALREKVKDLESRQEILQCAVSTLLKKKS